MIKLLIIADDFTGALDTGVQFAASGASTRVVTDVSFACGLDDANVEVLVVDAETRHLAAAAAFQVVQEIAAVAVRHGVRMLYKKTDSALRGNIGSELAAMLAGSGMRRIHFVPAYPLHGRTTVDGVHYIDEVPVAQSVFGSDPFEPVCHSAVAEIIAAQTDLRVTDLTTDSALETLPDGIVVYDAQTDEQMKAIARELHRRGETRLLAGCAGLASTLPELLGMSGAPHVLPAFDEGFFVACGSVNPITCEQLSCAEQNGFLRIRLTPEQKLAAAHAGERAAAWEDTLRNHPHCILDVNDVQTGESDAYAKAHGITTEQLRRTVSENMGVLIKRQLDSGMKKNLMVTGGDTLLAFLAQIDVKTLEPVCELIPGAVLSRLRYAGHTYNLISKSGGFGERTLLPELVTIMKNSGNGGE